MTHTTALGHIPAAGAASWGCTCGAAGVLTYAPSTPPRLAMRVIAGRAAHHRRDAAMKEAPPC